MKACCFIGHRNTKGTPELCKRINETVISLIKEKEVKTFFFGSKSGFDDLCLKIVREIKKEHPEIKLIYVRSSFPHIEQFYREYLLSFYDDTFMPPKIENAGKASYIERNQAMIDASDYCIFYYDKNYTPPLKDRRGKMLLGYQPKSGTTLAYDYATQKNKNIITLQI